MRMRAYGGTTGRVAKIIWHLAEGGAMTTTEVAAQLKIRRQGAYAMLCRASAVVPIVLDDEGKWRKMDKI